VKGWRFCDISDIFKNAMKELKMFWENGFKKCFQQICSRWEKYIFS
jgi:hypothetical protein